MFFMQQGGSFSISGYPRHGWSPVCIKLSNQRNDIFTGSTSYLLVLGDCDLVMLLKKVNQSFF